MGKFVSIGIVFCTANHNVCKRNENNVGKRDLR